MSESKVVRGFANFVNCEKSVEVFMRDSGVARFDSDEDATILRHKDQGVGDFKPWMVEYLNNPDDYEKPKWLLRQWDNRGIGSWQEWMDKTIAAAIAKLFEEGEDEQQV